MSTQIVEQLKVQLKQLQEDRKDHEKAEAGDSLRIGFDSLWITDYKKGLLSRIAIQDVLSQ